MNIEGGDQTQNETTAKAADEVEQCIVFDIDGEEYAVLISDVREVVEVPSITPVPDSPAFILGIMNLRGKVVPVLDLEKRLGLTRKEPVIGRHILVSDYGNTLMGVQVDEVKEVLRTKKKSIQPSPSLVSAAIAPEFLSGVIVLPKQLQADNTIDTDGPIDTTSDMETTTSTPQQESRVILLLNLKKIITLEELQSLTVPAGQAGDSTNEEKHTGGVDA